MSAVDLSAGVRDNNLQEQLSGVMGGDDGVLLKKSGGSGEGRQCSREEIEGSEKLHGRKSEELRGAGKGVREAVEGGTDWNLEQLWRIYI